MMIGFFSSFKCQNLCIYFTQIIVTILTSQLKLANFCQLKWLILAKGDALEAITLFE